MVQMSRCRSSAPLENASLVPSGDHAGPSSHSVLWVSWRRFGAVGVHHVDLAVAVHRGLERDLAAVGRPGGRRVVARRARVDQRRDHAARDVQTWMLRAFAALDGREQQLLHVGREARIELVLGRDVDRPAVAAVEVHRPDVRARRAGAVGAPVEQAAHVREPRRLARLRAVRSLRDVDDRRAPGRVANREVDDRDLELACCGGCGRRSSSRPAPNRTARRCRGGRPPAACRRRRPPWSRCRRSSRRRSTRRCCTRCVR